MSRTASTALAIALSCSPGTLFADETPQQRGAYLVNAVTICGRCHTTPGPASKPFAGGRIIETPAYKVQGSNITPDVETGIGGWSDKQIGRAITEGLRPDGSRISSAMPYGFYTALTEADLKAIVAYLRSLAPVKNAVAPPVYSVPVTPAVGVVVRSDASPLPEVARGDYLATLARCLACHSTPNADGEPDLGEGSGHGGMSFEGPWGVVVAPDITPLALSSWSNDDIRRALVEGKTPDGRRLAAPMQSKAYAQMSGEDIDALIAWLRTPWASK